MKAAKIIVGFQKFRQVAKLGCDVYRNGIDVTQKSVEIVMSESNAVATAETVKQLRKAADRFTRRAAKLQAELNAI